MQHNNIIAFPESKDKRLQAVINVCSKDNASWVLGEFVKLIDDGCSEAYAFVGAIYEAGGEGIKPDLEKARIYYEKSVEEFGAVEAYLALGRIYFYGLGIEKNYEQAIEYYLKVEMEDGCAIADLMLGKLYQVDSTAHNLDKAKFYYKRAAKKGNVFGWTFLGKLEQEHGNILRGISIRIFAGLKALLISIKDENDKRLRYS